MSSPKDEPAHSVRRHYMWSNERRHDLFAGELTGVRGGYVGVGGDQNYTIAARMQADAIWLIDLDAAVVRMHRLYIALLKESATPAEFLGHLGKRSTAAVRAAVEKHYPEAAEQRAILEIYYAYRADLEQHLRGEQRRLLGKQPATWIADEASYQHLRTLAQKGLMVPRLGDLNGPSTMQEIGAAATRARLPIRALYLSNAESWFRYSPALARNVGSLPLDERSLVLRTVKSSLLAYPPGDIWHYSVQRGDDFKQKLTRPSYAKVDVAMLDAVLVKKQTGLSRIGCSPPGSEASERPFYAQASAGRRDAQREREQRQALLRNGLVTRPAGNREHAREMDRDRMKRAALELQKSTQ